MNGTRVLLAFTGISLALFGAVYLFDPLLVYSSYGLGIDGVTNVHVVRSASGGPLLAIGLVILGGAFIRSLEVVSLSLHVTYLGGVALGRAVSMVVDRLPPVEKLTWYFLVELMLTLAGAYLPNRRQKQSAKP